MWTQFWDMHSGGSQKLDWKLILIEAPEREAISVFYSRFDRNPRRVTCTCCGPDYFISEYPTLAEATAYHRGCRWSKEANCYVEENDPDNTYRGFTPIFDYVDGGGTDHEKARFIFAPDISDDERHLDVPDEGYIWKES